MKNIKIANINVKLKNLFLRWLELTVMFHKLTKKERQVLALLLYYHFTLKKDITNPKILWKLVFDYDTKMKIKEELNMKDASFQNCLTALRKKNVIKDNMIVPTYIPELEVSSKSFKIVYNLNITDNE